MDLICIDLPSEIGFFAALICRFRRKRYLVRVLGDWGKAVYLDNHGRLAGKLKAFIADQMAHTVVTRADLAMFQGGDLFEKYAQQVKDIAKSDKIHSTLTQEMFFARQGASFHSPLRLITVSRLVPLKGLDVLLKAIQLLTERNLEVEWWCVGEGPARSALEQLAAKLGQTQRVKFLGNIPNGPELYRLYREADIFVLPSLTEGISQSLLEALANSLPVVASEVGGIPSVLTNKVNGLLVAPGDHFALAKAILKLAARPTLAEQLQQAGFARAQCFRADILRQACRELIETTFGQIEVQLPYKQYSTNTPL
jgi:glycosyltransferase involved in cell wall biosynthesis